MADDELAEINGIKPKLVIKDGEEVEAKSQTSKSVYKVKRTWDHYYCTCPAWRNQSRMPTNARSCKHLRSMLGDDYEDARLQLKNPDGSPPKATKAGTKKTVSKKPASKAASAKPASKAAVSAKPASKAAAPGKPLSTARASTRGKSKKEEADEVEHVQPAKPASTRASTRGKRKKEEEEEDEEQPAKKAPRSARSTRASARGKERVKEEVIAEEPEDQLMEEADAGASAPVADSPPKGGGKEEASDEGAKDHGDEEETVEEQGDKGGPAPVDDELAEINGIKPKQLIKDGEEVEAKSMTSDTVYKVKRTWDHYYCTCPAWRNQGGMPTNARSCKHLRALLGDAYEDARLHFKNPDGPAPKSKSSGKKPASKARGTQSSARTKKGDEDDDEGEDDDEDDDGATSGKKQPALLLANKWDLESGPDPTGWWISEKLDGVRTYYDGTHMISRLGNPFTPPQWLLDKLPKDMTLDGELFGGRGEFQSTVSIVKTVNSPHWQNITFQIFDIPSMGSEPFEDRLSFLNKTFGPGGTHVAEHIEVVQHEQARDRDHVLAKLKEIESLGGEGLMLRKPESTYVGSRSSTLLKVKTFYDAEAVVTGYMPGKGQHKGVTGALKCEMSSGKKFNVGSGLTHKQRQNPPKVGAIITYRFQELTRDGVPRFPSFLGEAADKTEAKDAEVPEHRKGAQPQAGV